MSQPPRPSIVLRALRRLAPDLGRADPARAPLVWLKEPASFADAEVCLFASYCAGGRVSDHALFHARAWAAQGFSVVLIAAVDDVADFDPAQDLGFCAGVLTRANVGYDFGSWSTAFRELGGLTDARMVVIANDSVFGPLDNFAPMIARIRQASADVVGVVESRQVRRHFQSFLVAFKRQALASPVFQRFWSRVRVGGRQHVIDRYELTLVAELERAGLSAEALFPVDPENPYANPTLTDWRGLILRGFPYLKVQLIRENPHSSSIEGWRQELTSRGFDAALAEAHLGRGKT